MSKILCVNFKNLTYILLRFYLFGDTFMKLLNMRKMKDNRRNGDKTKCISMRDILAVPLLNTWLLTKFQLNRSKKIVILFIKNTINH